MTELNKLGLPQRILTSLEQADFHSVGQVLKASKHDLNKVANLSESDIITVKTLAAKSYPNLKFISGMDIQTAISFNQLSVGCPKLDQFLGGGINIRGITELVGESGSGKTQLCLQMSLMVQYPIANGGLDGEAVYICTEGAFPSTRLQQLTETFTTKLQVDYKKAKSEIKFGDNIFIEHISDADSLRQCIHFRLSNLLARRKIKLVVIDSIAGAFRADYEKGSAASRAKDLQNIGFKLHHLAEQFDLAIVCVNQVTEVPTNELKSGLSRSKVACLGLAWANMVTTRLQLSRVNAQLRTIEVVFSPSLASESCHYNITESGVAAIF